MTIYRCDCGDSRLEADGYATVMIDERGEPSDYVFGGPRPNWQCYVSCAGCGRTAMLDDYAVSPDRLIEVGSRVLVTATEDRLRQVLGCDAWLIPQITGYIGLVVDVTGALGSPAARVTFEHSPSVVLSVEHLTLYKGGPA